MLLPTCALSWTLASPLSHPSWTEGALPRTTIIIKLRGQTGPVRVTPMAPERTARAMGRVKGLERTVGPKPRGELSLFPMEMLCIQQTVLPRNFMFLFLNPRHKTTGSFLVPDIITLDDEDKDEVMLGDSDDEDDDIQVGYDDNLTVLQGCGSAFIFCGPGSSCFSQWRSGSSFTKLWCDLKLCEKKLPGTGTAVSYEDFAVIDPHQHQQSAF